eukprot:c52803_g1_i1.p2 GENE.c52803_g1_i1~~c52803_g1_i1.p2  ORF type:complete len:114 (-),score=32.28 c52803_g1_i1:86-427(-)
MRLKINGREGTQPYTPAASSAVTSAKKHLDETNETKEPEKAQVDFVEEFTSFVGKIGCEVDFSGWDEQKLRETKLADLLAAGVTKGQGARLVAKLRVLKRKPAQKAAKKDLDD